MNEPTFLSIRIRLELLVTEREGMITENEQRKTNGESMAYPEYRFMELAEQMNDLAKEITEIRNLGL